MQGHSVESSLPPLPENGLTAETAALELDVKCIDDSSVPFATSQEEENAEATEEQPNPAATVGKHRRKKLRLAHSLSSSPAKDPELKDDATSSSPPRMQASPLKACPLSSMPPPPTAGGIRFGGPGDIPSLSEDDDRYVNFDMRVLSLYLFFAISQFWVFFLCSDAEDLASPPRALTVSPGRVASPLAIDAPLQLEVALTAPATSVEKAVVMPDVTASSSRLVTWEEHISYFLCISCNQCFLYAYSAYRNLLAMLWSRLARPFLGWSKRKMRSVASLSSKLVSISTR